MMTKPQAAALIARLMATYPNYRPVDETLAAEIWLEIVGYFPVELVKAALMQYASESHDFAPAPGTVREYAIKLQAKAAGVPTAAAALDEVLRMPASMESHEWVEEGRKNIILIRKLKFSHSFVEKTARMMGWPRNFPSDNTTADRAQFLKIYESELKNALDAEYAPPAVRAYLGKPQSIKGLLEAK